MLTGGPAFPVLGGNVTATMYPEDAAVRRAGHPRAPAGGVGAPGGIGQSDAPTPIPRCVRTAQQGARRPRGRSRSPPTHRSSLAPMNPGFPGSASGGSPEGWFDGPGLRGRASRRGITPRVETSPGQVVRVRFERTAAPGTSEFGSLMQRCPARHLAGRRVRLEGRLRSERRRRGAASRALAASRWGGWGPVLRQHAEIARCVAPRVGRVTLDRSRPARRVGVGQLRHRAGRLGSRLVRIRPPIVRRHRRG